MRIIFLLFALSFAIAAGGQDLIVGTSNGKVEGSKNADQTIKIFKGIPFAAPPIDELRWKAPQPVEDWSGVKKCIDFSPSPIQNEPRPFYCWSEEFIAKPEPLSEDCLYLNIWTSGVSKKEKKPVFVWIYGGGLSSGSANCDIYDGEEMAKKGVVFVSLNYRIGIMGFMAHPELSAQSGYKSSGNYGFLDQIAALKWVQENISAFGGDPDNVTIAGQSAGAHSVTALIASPLAKGLFHKAIPQSGGLLSNQEFNNLQASEQQGIALMKKANCNSIAELRKMSAKELQKISNDSEVGRFGTTLDGYVLPKDLMSHFKKGLQNKTPVLAGWVTGDGSFRGSTEKTVAEYKKEANTKYGKNADAYLKIFHASTSEEVQDQFRKLSLLNFAGMPAHLLAGFNSYPTYVYQFDHAPPAKKDFPDYGAFHTSEVPFVLHTLHTWDRTWREVDRRLENTISTYWVNFAKTGNPNGTGLPTWEAYDKTTGKIMVLGDKVGTKAGLLKKEFDFLEMLN